jgi:peptide/nickel transport system ATP-binding protein
LAPITRWHCHERQRGRQSARRSRLRFTAGNPAIVALAGQSGSGKTTAAQLLLGLASPTSGTIEYGGTPLGRLGRAARHQFRRDVQAVLQDPYASFNPVYRVSHVFDVAARNFRVGAAGAERRIPPGCCAATRTS